MMLAIPTDDALAIVKLSALCDLSCSTDSTNIFYSNNLKVSHPTNFLRSHAANWSKSVITTVVPPKVINHAVGLRLLALSMIVSSLAHSMGSILISKLTPVSMG